MTKMLGLGQCGRCHYWIVLYGKIGFCNNPDSDHFGHVIMQGHPICDEFLQEEQKK